MDEIYGSELILLKVDDAPPNHKVYHQSYKFRKTYWKALDTPEKRCDESSLEANTTQCITRYLEQTVGCSLGLAGSDKQITM